MLRKNNSMITEATATLQAAFNAEDTTPEVMQGAFEQFAQAIAATVQAAVTETSLHSVASVS